MRNPGSLTLRSPLIWGAPIAGFVAGAALWLLVGGPSAPAKALDALARQGGPSTARAAGEDAAAAAISVLASRPLFAEGNVSLPRIAVIGVSRIPGRSAALVAMNGGEPAWVRVGETVEGLTLVATRTDEARFDSINGPVTVPLGETVDLGAAAAPPTGGAPDKPPPPGVKLPPEPASAPQP